MALAQDTIRFTPKIGYQAFKVREPVLRLKPGQVLVSETLMGGYYTEEGGAWPGEVGPIYIEGATPKDQLVIKLLKVRPNRDLAPARVNPNLLRFIKSSDYNEAYSQKFSGRVFEAVFRFFKNPKGEMAGQGES